MDKTERLNWIDTTKGLLIIGVLLFHFSPIYRINFGGGITPLVRLTYFYVPFFMPAFFVITGFCTNFNKQFKDFTINNLRTLMIPALSLSMISGLIETQNIQCLRSIMDLKFWLNGFSFWFFPALFISKELYWFINKLDRNYTLSIITHICIGIGLMAFASFLFFNDIPNVWHFQNAMALTCFLWFGKFLKNYNKINILLYTGAIFYIILAILPIHHPFVMERISFAPIYTPIYMIQAIFGCCLIIKIGQIINKCAILELFGKHTLVIYGLHWCILTQLLIILSKITGFNQSIILITTIIITISLTLLICLMCSILLNQKYVSYLIGRF